jgi:enoyl-CoA hydratase
MIRTGSPQLEATVEGGVAWLTLTNPQRHNALTLDMLVGLEKVVPLLEEGEEIRAVVLSGQGGRAFASGVDISGLAGAPNDRPGDRLDEAFNSALNAWRALRKPVIAMIEGYCIGGGVSLALEADIRICCEHSVFQIPAARIGIGYPDVGPLVRTVGPSWAAEILFSGRRLSSHEAMTAGIVNRVTECEDLRSSVAELAHLIAENAPLSIAAAKAGIRQLGSHAADRDPELLNELVKACARSDDLVEGTKAWREKRRPRFRGC